MVQLNSSVMLFSGLKARAEVNFTTTYGHTFRIHSFNSYADTFISVTRAFFFVDVYYKGLPYANKSTRLTGKTVFTRP